MWSVSISEYVASHLGTHFYQTRPTIIPLYRRGIAIISLLWRKKVGAQGRAGRKWQSQDLKPQSAVLALNRLPFCCVLSHSVMSNSATLWTAARQAPLSVGFSRQEHCSGLPFPSPEYLPDPGTEPASPAWASRCFTAELPGEPSLTLLNSASFCRHSGCGQNNTRNFF